MIGVWVRDLDQSQFSLLDFMVQGTESSVHIRILVLTDEHSI